MYHAYSIDAEVIWVEKFDSQKTNLTPDGLQNQVGCEGETESVHIYRPGKKEHKNICPGKISVHWTLACVKHACMVYYMHATLLRGQ